MLQIGQLLPEDNSPLPDFFDERKTEETKSDFQTFCWYLSYYGMINQVNRSVCINLPAIMLAVLLTTIKRVRFRNQSEGYKINKAFLA